MSSNSTHEFPVSVGGVPYPLDFAPSILFAVLYGLMLPVVVFRMVHPRSRNGVLIGTTVFSIERYVVISFSLLATSAGIEAQRLISIPPSVVSYSLRAHAAYSARTGGRISEGLETYFQTTYSGGFLSIGQDLMQLFRALLVSSTLGGNMLALHKLTPPLVWEAQTKARHADREDVPLTAGPSDRDDDDGDSGAGYRSGWPKANASVSMASVGA